MQKSSSAARQYVTQLAADALALREAVFDSVEEMNTALKPLNRSVTLGSVTLVASKLK